MKIHTKHKVSVIIPFVTMADIAFLLLIFLIITSSAQKKADVDLLLPESSTFDKVREKNNSEVFITHANALYYGHRRYASVDALCNDLPPQSHCVIKADTQADFKVVYAITEYLKKNEYEKVTFAVARKSTLGTGE